MAIEDNILPVIPQNRREDLIGLEHLDQAQLVLFLAGNQYMAIPEILRMFQAEHPEVEHVFCETLPPKLELRQILAGGARFGNQILPGTPDIYACVSGESMNLLAEKGLARGKSCVYLRNRIALMVKAGNPLGIARVKDLAKDKIRVAQPDPEYEDIAQHILHMYHEAGGDSLIESIMERKREAGLTLMTTVHHRETPELILADKADVGPVWATEIAYAKSLGLPLDGVEVGEDLDQRRRVEYLLCEMIGAPQPVLARVFAFFLRTPAVQRIFEKYGFLPVWAC